MERITILTFFLFYHLISHAQKQKTLESSKHQLSFDIGLGYDDGIISLNKNPTIGISYERKVSKRFSLGVHILSYYQNFSDTYLNSKNPDYPNINKYRGSLSPFLTEKEKKTLDDSGIKQIDPSQIIKRYSLPIGIGLTFYPIEKTHHRLGLNWSFCMTYETRNYWQDFTPVTIIKTDGTEQKILLSTPTEFRDFSPGFSSKIHYEYVFNKFSLGYRISAYNIFLLELFGAPNSSIWNQSIFCTYKF